MSGTAAQLKIEVGLSAGKVGHGKTTLTNQLKTHLGRRTERRNFPSILIVQSGGGHWPLDAYNIRLASNWPGRDWLRIDMGADSWALGADGRLEAQIEALDEVVVVAWEYRIFL